MRRGAGRGGEGREGAACGAGRGCAAPRTRTLGAARAWPPPARPPLGPRSPRPALRRGRSRPVTSGRRGPTPSHFPSIPEPSGLPQPGNELAPPPCPRPPAPAGRPGGRLEGPAPGGPGRGSPSGARPSEPRGARPEQPPLPGGAERTVRPPGAGRGPRAVTGSLA